MSDQARNTPQLTAPKSPSLPRWLAEGQREAVHFASAALENRRLAVHAARVLPANRKVSMEAFMESYHGMPTHPQSASVPEYAETRHSYLTRLCRRLRCKRRSKSYLRATYAEACRAMIELHGGSGHTRGYGADIWRKRALFNRNLLGPPRQHRLRAAELAGLAGW